MIRIRCKHQAAYAIFKTRLNQIKKRHGKDRGNERVKNMDSFGHSLIQSHTRAQLTMVIFSITHSVGDLPNQHWRFCFIWEKIHVLEELTWNDNLHYLILAPKTITLSHHILFYFCYALPLFLSFPILPLLREKNGKMQKNNNKVRVGSA